MYGTTPSGTRDHVCSNDNRTMGVASAGLQAAVLGTLAAYLTYSFTGPLGLHWELKDYGFVAAVTLAVFYNRLKTQKFEVLMQAEQTKQMSQAPELRRIELVHGQPVQLELNKVTCLLFFVSCLVCLEIAALAIG